MTYQPGIYRAQGANELHFKDNALLYFGSSDDVSVKWDATNLVILPVADDTGALHIGNGTVDFDVKVFLSTSAKYVLFDVGNVLLTLEDVDLHLGDNDKVEFGDAAGGDVQILWNATNLVITPAVDDTGAIHIGDGTKDIDVRIHQGTTTDYVEFDVGAKALEVVGDTRIDLSSATIASANTDGGLIKAGTSSARVVEDTANMKFLSFYFDNGATSGDNRGIYNRLYLTGAGGGGESLRCFTTVEDVAGGTAHGAHISLNFASTGTVTGLGVAGRNTLHIANQATQAGTMAALQAEIWSDGATSDPAGSQLSAIRVVNDGDATGKADVDDDAALFEFAGWGVGDGNAIATKAAGAAPNVTHSFRVRLPDNSLVYLYAGPTALTA